MQRKKIIVALSGGVDSAVAAALLQQQGYDVEGVYLKVASETLRRQVNTAQCSWEDDFASVTAIGKRLGITVRSLNVEREYRDRVVRYFTSEYAANRTPNPDVLCNREIKFGVLLEWARQRGIAQLATGHYARISNRSGFPVLKAGRDPEKDQSYFLHAIPPTALAAVRFPIGHLRKPEVRAIAHRLSLPNADRPDSQGVCFLGDFDVREFLKATIPLTPGPVVTTDGTFVGTHRGLEIFTIGQRHGLAVGGGTPLYVVGKDRSSATLCVAAGSDHPALLSQGLEGSNLSWLAPGLPPPTLHCAARTRYRQPLARATVLTQPDRTFTVTFVTPQRAVAPGQAVVWYDGTTVLGGGTIDRAIPIPTFDAAVTFQTHAIAAH